jgi:DNA-directed RNA polymerase III subunit RPC5
MDIPDEGLVARLPIRLSGRLGNDVHVHQYPLLARPLQTPPSAADNGKSITARIKPRAGRLEVHVPVEISPDVWNSSKGREYGTARQDDDRERNQFDGNQNTSNLEEVRLKSEAIVQTGIQVLGIVRDGWCQIAIAIHVLILL